METSIKKFSGMELADELDLSDEENSDWDYDGVLARKLTNFEVPANLLEKVARLNEFLMTKGIKSLKISELNEEKIREKLDGKYGLNFFIVLKPFFDKCKFCKFCVLSRLKSNDFERNWSYFGHTDKYVEPWKSYQKRNDRSKFTYRGHSRQI